ncbi:MAG: cyclase family protein [Deltaproteobacteria bacterium]|nr:cyclase family protein [Deltaproteobacteria bacterium]
MKVIDLTHTLSPGMLVLPGNPRPVFEWIKRDNSDPYNATYIRMGAHTGTHCDAPLHFIPASQTIDEIPLERFFGKARLFRSKEQPRHQEIGLKEVLDSGFTLGEAKIFLLETGIGSYAEKREYNELYPVPGNDLLDWLLEKGVLGYMTDATDVDRPNDVTAPNHLKLLGKGVPIVENLHNLGLLPENKDFIVSAMPLKLLAREGSPCRAAALVD